MMVQSRGEVGNGGTQGDSACDDSSRASAAPASTVVSCEMTESSPSAASSCPLPRSRGSSPGQVGRAASTSTLPTPESSSSVI